MSVGDLAEWGGLAVAVASGAGTLVVARRRKRALDAGVTLDSWKAYTDRQDKERQELKTEHAAERTEWERKMSSLGAKCDRLQDQLATIEGRHRQAMRDLEDELEARMAPLRRRVAELEGQDQPPRRLRGVTPTEGAS